ncbi:uncharacterized protein F4807DRAFT_444561 [Annulohypoxylon truncatum]|uniref:uncharacterized protein n=1 Tax=Annulohypoxylon truncatum TaxID=327061 RepID=UPI0020078033|nr:uncharacterized protein F4807DRAFT_444561 [Annulohypoxylon truncatum]KAI1205107.1 hypothetical protein F4807DRAFT_444561 [Annulohypoxylon truncatum]
MTSIPLLKRSVICRSFHQSTILPALTTSASYRINALDLDRRDQLKHTAFPNPSRPQTRYTPCIVHNLRGFTTTRTLNMASDDDYMAFLNKANEDPSKGYTKAQTSSKQDFKATDDGAQIPAAIQEATKDSFYVSDADEPFVPVYLAWDEGGKGLPDEEEFATLIHHPEPANAQIEILDPADWDSQGQYKAILDAAQKAGKGNDIRVYRVSKGGVKVEYWVVTTEGKGASAKLVGAKALAVES